MTGGLRAPRSLQGRLLLLLLGGLLLVSLGTALLAWREVRHELDELLDGHLAQAAALLLAQQARGVDHEEDDDEIERLDAPSLHRYAPRVMFQVWRDGQLTARSANAPVEPMLTQQRGFATRDIDGTPWRIFAAHAARRDVQVYMGEQIDSRAAIVKAVLGNVFGPMALALALLALGVWAAVRHSMAPLRRLSAKLAARAPHDLQPVQLPAAPAEMAPLLAALNGLFERIARLLDTERRFTADAAHELRTPIAALRMQAQVALGAGDDDATRRHALQATLQGCDRATRLVEQLLMLARLEAEGAPAAASAGADVDLATLTRRVVADAAGGALAQRQDLELDADAPVLVRVNEALLGVLVRNLVDNAVRYSPPGAQIRVAVRTEGDQAVLDVQDSGPGLSDAEIARLGERFYRVLRADSASGSGLGWSIVRRIAQVQGARVALARSADLGGLAVHVSWPRASGSAAA